MSFEWSKEAIDRMKALALDGKSAAAIAELLGAPSKNSVIGKARRVGIRLTSRMSWTGEMRREAIERARRQRAKEREARVAAGELPKANSPKRTAPKARTPNTMFIANRRAVTRNDPGLPKAPVHEKTRPSIACHAPAAIKIGPNKALVDLRLAGCRWPLGDPQADDFSFCGTPAVEGRSYCVGHCRMAYQPRAPYSESTVQ